MIKLRFWYCPKCEAIQQVIFLDEMSFLNMCQIDGAICELYEVDIKDLKQIWRKQK